MSDKHVNLVSERTRTQGVPRAVLLYLAQAANINGSFCIDEKMYRAVAKQNHLGFWQVEHNLRKLHQMGDIDVTEYLRHEEPRKGFGSMDTGWKLLQSSYQGTLAEKYIKIQLPPAPHKEPVIISHSPFDPVYFEQLMKRIRDKRRQQGSPENE